MRVTLNNSRHGLSVHNFREAKIGSHIDPEKSKNNFYWSRYPKIENSKERELHFYKETFEEHLNAQNARYKAQRHEDKIKTKDIKAYYAKNRPEETLYYIGNRDDHADPEMLKEIAKEFLSWRQRAFPQCVVLDFALHVDEEGAPHIHERHAYVAHDKGGYIYSERKALDQMGVQRPNPLKPQGRYNNAKVTFTRMCREKLQEIAKSHGLYIETEPKEPARRRDRSLYRYQINEMKKDLQELVESAKEKQIQHNDLIKQINEDLEKIHTLEEKISDLQNTPSLQEKLNEQTAQQEVDELTLYLQQIIRFGEETYGETFKRKFYQWQKTNSETLDFER